MLVSKRAKEYKYYFDIERAIGVRLTVRQEIDGSSLLLLSY